jgi:hypothetical protein
MARTNGAALGSSRSLIGAADTAAAITARRRTAGARRRKLGGRMTGEPL